MTCWVRVTMLAPLVAVAVACHAGPTLIDAAGNPDAVGMVPATCAGATICDGTSVRACRSGTTAEILESCAAESLTCARGRCISEACAAAESNQGLSLGCTFYTFRLDNVTFDNSIPTAVLVTNPGQVLATASLERRSNGAWVSVSSMSVAPMRSARFEISDPPFQDSGSAVQLAFRVSTDRPVTVSHIQSDDSVEGGSTSTGATILLPEHALGQHYRAVTYPQVATPRLVATPGARGGAGQVVIIGTQDNTLVTVTAPPGTPLEPGAGAPAIPPGGLFTLSVNEGDYYQLFSARDGDDLTGTQIDADRPVAVFSGNISTTYGVAATGISSPDLAHEQLLPVAAWGTSYVAAQLVPQVGVCDPMFDPPGSSIWTILADVDDTHVHFAPLAHSATTPPDRTLAAGESFRVVVPESFAVTADHAFLVMQGMDCEPTLSSAVPTNPWLTDYRFAVLPNFDTMMALARPAAEALYLDGARIEDSLFEPVGNGFEVARIPIEACRPEDVVCTHQLEGKFGFTIRGMDVLNSYAMTAPAWSLCNDSGAPNCVR
jgi:hypothetical protein